MLYGLASALIGEASLTPLIMLPGIAMSFIPHGWLILFLSSQPFFALSVFNCWWG
jgi:hypothetical protein